jgi:hypothetical protein
MRGAITLQRNPWHNHNRNPDLSRSPRQSRRRLHEHTASVFPGRPWGVRTGWRDDAPARPRAFAPRDVPEPVAGDTRDITDHVPSGRSRRLDHVHAQPSAPADRTGHRRRGVRTSPPGVPVRARSPMTLPLTGQGRALSPGSAGRGPLHSRRQIMARELSLASGRCGRLTPTSLRCFSRRRPDRRASASRPLRVVTSVPAKTQVSEW